MILQGTVSCPKQMNQEDTKLYACSKEFDFFLTLYREEMKRFEIAQEVSDQIILYVLNYLNASENRNLEITV